MEPLVKNKRLPPQNLSLNSEQTKLISESFKGTGVYEILCPLPM